MPRKTRLAGLRADAADCTRCRLYRYATQTVFGEGPDTADVVMIGEQPGDKEDLAGHPFVGPAGAMLDRALEEAGIDRAAVYVTNTVKHFKYTRQGKRRVHKKPNAEEIKACRVWLDGELDAIGPKAIVCLGATAAQALLGRSFRVTQMRGKPVPSDLAPFVMATVHPSSILRAPDDASRREAYDGLVADLRALAKGLRRKQPAKNAG